jgi:hypothetical protein
MTDDVEYIAECSNGGHELSRPEPQPDEPASRLSTIDEEPSDLTEDTMFIHDEPNWAAADRAATKACLLCARDCMEEITQPDSDLDNRIWEIPFTDEVEALLASHVTGTVIPESFNPEEEYLELCCTVETAKFAYQGDRASRQAELIVTMHGEHLCVRTYTATGTTQTVIQRDDALLTPDEVKTHWSDVMSAIKQELETWVKYGCISRKKRNCARNIIYVKWVIKWKFGQAARSVHESQQTGPANTKRVIRARLTVRGFKDVDARHLDNYVGTSQRYSQRIIVSVAAQNQWDICTTDISKAFLQKGVTYKELAEATGEPLREVNFVLPAYCVAVLRTLPGYEDFHPRTEVFHCEKPGTGCNDAPRCFSLKLAQATRTMCGLKPGTVDGELCMKHVVEAGRP